MTEESNMELIKMEIKEEPLSGEEMEYQAYSVMEGGLKNSWPEDSAVKEVCVKVEQEEEMFQVQRTDCPQVENSGASQRHSEMELQSKFQGHHTDCPQVEEDSGAGQSRNSKLEQQSLGEVDYETYFVKEEPLDIDCAEDDGALELLTMPQSPHKQGGPLHVESRRRCKKKTLRVSLKRLDEHYLSQVLAGTKQNSCGREADKSSLEMESTLQISADGIHSDDGSPSKAELGIQSDSSKGKKSTSGNAGQEKIDGSMRSVQEMSGDRLSGEKHLQDLSLTSDCTIHLGEEDIAEKETSDFSSSDLIRGGMNTKNKTNKEKGQTTLVQNVPSYQPQLPIKDSMSTPVPAPKQTKPYQCSVCSKGYSSGDSLSRHMKTHTDERLHQCPLCGKIFSQKNILTEHIRLHRDEKRHQCTLCGKVFSTRGNLNKHRIIHSGEKPHKCRICDKEFYDSNYLLIHMRTHTGERPYQCSICSKEFSTSSNVTRHMKTHTGHQAFKCLLCHKCFSSRHRLNRHMMIHTKEHACTCPVCCKRFVRDDLSEHMKSHKGEKSINSNSEGDVTFDQKNQADHHSALSSPNSIVADDMKSDKGNQSSESDISVPAKSHMSKKRYPCIICNKEFTKIILLQRHMTTHTGEKSFKCSLCGKGFSLMHHLKRHMKIHTGEKDYLCSVCGKRFALDYYLTDHMKIHTGEKPHECSYCGKKFSQSTNLTKHNRIHTGEKPYHCTVCGSKFSKSDNLSKHKQTHMVKNFQ